MDCDAAAPDGRVAALGFGLLPPTPQIGWPEDAGHGVAARRWLQPRV